MLLETSPRFSARFQCCWEPRRDLPRVSNSAGGLAAIRGDGVYVVTSVHSFDLLCQQMYANNPNARHFIFPFLFFREHVFFRGTVHVVLERALLHHLDGG
jgi:hypothetical protein